MGSINPSMAMATPTKNLTIEGFERNAAGGQQNGAVEDTSNNKDNIEEESLAEGGAMSLWERLVNFFSLTSCLEVSNEPMFVLPRQLPDSDDSSKIIGTLVEMVNVSNLIKNSVMLHGILRKSYENGDIPLSYDEMVSKGILYASIVLQAIAIFVVFGLWYQEMNNDHGDNRQIRMHGTDEEVKAMELEVEASKQKQRKRNLKIILFVSCISCILEVSGAILSSANGEQLTNQTHLKSN